MKRVTLIVPLLATAAFAAYYHHHGSADYDCFLPRAAVPATALPSPYADRDGAADAQADRTAGRLVFLTHGRVTPVIAAFQAELQDRHGIELRFVTDATTLDPETNRYTIAYNAVMIPAIFAAQGDQVFDQARDRAWVAWREAFWLQ